MACVEEVDGWETASVARLKPLFPMPMPMYDRPPQDNGLCLPPNLWHDKNGNEGVENTAGRIEFYSRKTFRR